MLNRQLFDLSTNKGFDFQWVSALPNGYDGVVIPGAGVHGVVGSFGDFVFQHKIKNGYAIWYSYYNVLKRVHTHARLQGPFIELSMLFTPDMRYHLQPFGKVQQKSWQFNLFHSTEMDNKTQFEAGSELTTFDIHLEVAFLDELFADFPDLLGPFLEQIHAGRPMRYFEQPMYATPEMVGVIKLIRRQLMDPQLHDGYLDYLVSILLIQAMMVKTSANYCPMRFDDVLMLRSLLDNLIELALSDLSEFKGSAFYARKGAMSATTLKKYMSIVKGRTLRDLWNEARLTACLEEVLNSNQSLSSIAHSYNFARLNSFRRAFKSKFGMAPKKLRKLST